MTALAPEIESTYEVLREMGGGMGAVYQVRHRLFGEIRVIKVMQTALAENTTLRERFDAEARRGKMLHHRNIAEVLDFMIGSNGKPHLIMEYVDGVNLRELARNRDPLDPRLVVDIACQTLDALRYLHEHSLIHRDISPDNLMLTRDLSGAMLVKLIDLGIAKSLQDNTVLTQTGSFMGKLAYASPEQFSGKADARTDFYSLGVVLYELLTGVMPITGATTAELILAHCQKPPRAFEETDPHGRVPPSLRAVILKALAKDPSLRYQTAAEFSSALRAALPEPAQPRSLSRQTTVVDAGESFSIIKDAPPRSNVVPLLVVVAGLLIVIAALAIPLFRRTIDSPRVTQKQPQYLAQAAAPPPSASPSGASIAIEAPRPVIEAPNETATVELPVAQPVTNSNPPPVPQPVTKSSPAPVATTTPPRRVDTVVTHAEKLPARVLTADELREGDTRRREALAYSTSHDWDRAIAAWRAFIAAYGGVSGAADHAAYYNLGVAYEAQRRWSDAAEAFESASVADLTSRDTANLLRLAHCYGKLGRWPDASTTYERILRIDPSNEIARKSLLFALRQQSSDGRASDR